MIAPGETDDSTNIAKGYFHLTADQKRFQVMLAQYWMLDQFWDFDDMTVDLSQLMFWEENLPLNEQVMARYFVNVWYGKEAMDFPLVKAASHLNKAEMDLVVGWMLNPFYPNGRDKPETRKEKKVLDEFALSQLEPS